MKIRNALLTAAACTTLSLVLAAQDAEAQPAAEAGVKIVHQSLGPPVKKPHDLLYLATPGGSGNGTLAPGGEGLVVLDADHNYRFIKRITDGYSTPSTEDPPAVTGITADTATNMIYVQRRGDMLAFDMGTDKLAWRQIYGGNSYSTAGRPADSGAGECCERGEQMPDGKTLIVGGNHLNFWYVIDAKTGALKGKIMTPMTTLSHNMAVSEDGKVATLATSAGTSILTVADPTSMKALRTINFTDIVRPLAINHDGSRVYVNEDNLLGFEIGDTTTGKMIKRVEAPAELWKAKWGDPNHHFFGHGCPSHGIAMTPDESEIWEVDNINYGMLVWDNTGQWPVFDAKKGFKTSTSAGWITMGLDGTPYGLRAYLGSGDVVDVKSHSIVAEIKDEYGNRFGSEKTLEVAVLDGKMVKTESQFSNGRAVDVEARLSTQNKRAAK